MLVLDESLKIYLCLEVVDMRKSINGLSICIVDDLASNPQDQALYIFYNRARNKGNVIYCGRGGLC